MTTLMKRSLRPPSGPLRARVWSALGGLVTVAMLLGNVGTAAAISGNVITFPQETDLVLAGPGITLKIVAGSVASTLGVATNTFTVSVSTGGTFTVRYPGPNPGNLANDGSLSSCNKVVDNNDVVVTGPKTVTFTPSATPVCVASGSSHVTPAATLSNPNGGEVWNVGSVHDILWGAAGTGVNGARLSASTDGGNTWSLVADNLSGGGFYSWTVPNTVTTQAKMKIELLGGGSVVASDVSDAVFSIVAPTSGGGGGSVTPPVVTPPATSAGTTPNGLIDGVGTSSTGAGAKTRLEANASLPPAFQVDSLVKLASDNDPTTQADTTVYYLGLDAKRHPFANGEAYSSWYADFSAVRTIDAATLASIPLGAPILARPGTRLVKIASDPKTYYVEPGYRLRWLKDEATAVKMFGSDWNRNVIDVDVSLYLRYVTGEPITLASLDTGWPSGSLFRLPGRIITWYVQAGQRRAFASSAFSVNNFQERFVLNSNTPSLLSLPIGSDINGQEDGLFSLMH